MRQRIREFADKNDYMGGVRAIAGFLLHSTDRILFNHDFNSSEHWKKRAIELGQNAVKFGNQEYDEFIRNKQKAFLRRFIPCNIQVPYNVLDIGCGTGEVSRILIDLSPQIYVDAVDFPEMIEIARQNNSSDRINYIESSAEQYLTDTRKYDLILSSSCLAAIKDLTKFKHIVDNLAAMINKDGSILMIEPLHKWNEYWRAKFGIKEMKLYLKRFGMDLVYTDGMLFWPYRQWLAGSNFHGKILERRFNQGEKLMTILGKNLWSDYKILLFKLSEGRYTGRGIDNYKVPI